MYLSDEELAERFRGNRPGLELVAIENAAVPVTILNISILAQEKKRIELLEEFLLRAIDNNLSEIAEISALLGISAELLEPALVSQLAAHNISYSASAQTVSLTQYGRRSVHELCTISPVETEVPIAFDRAVWKPAGYNVRDVIRRGEAERQGMILLPAKNSKTIGAHDVGIRDVQRLVRTEKADDRFQVLDIVRVRRSRTAYLPVKLLFFAERASVETGLLIVLDGEESLDHQSELAAVGGPEALGLTLDLSNRRNDSFESRMNGRAGPEFAEVPSDDASVSGALVRQLSVYEHGIELQRALSSVKTRLLIMSPSIRRAVVDTQLLADVERLLRRGVQVSIGYGPSGEGNESDEDALRSLRILQQRFAGVFVLSRISSIRASVLLYDDSFVSGNFYWLSFRGEPRKAYRLEGGSRVKSKRRSDAIYLQCQTDLRDS